MKFASVYSGKPTWRQVERLQSLEVTASGESKTLLQALIAEQVAYLTSRDHRRLGRSVDIASVATIIFLAIVAGGVCWWMIELDTWWSYTIMTAVSVFIALLVAAGSTQVFKYPDDEQPTVRQ